MFHYFSNIDHNENKVLALVFLSPTVLNVHQDFVFAVLYHVLCNFTFCAVFFYLIFVLPGSPTNIKNTNIHNKTQQLIKRGDLSRNHMPSEKLK